MGRLVVKIMTPASVALREEPAIRREEVALSETAFGIRAYEQFPNPSLDNGTNNKR